MLSVIRPDEPVEIRLLNQNNEVSDEEIKDVETSDQELRNMGTRFDQDWKNKIDEAQKSIAELEDRSLEHQEYADTLSSL